MEVLNAEFEYWETMKKSLNSQKSNDRDQTHVLGSKTNRINNLCQ